VHGEVRGARPTGWEMVVHWGTGGGRGGPGGGISEGGTKGQKLHETWFNGTNQRRKKKKLRKTDLRENRKVPTKGDGEWGQERVGPKGPTPRGWEGNGNAETRY